MALNLNRLGNYIEENNNRNSDLSLPLDKVRGISNTKEIMLTKARVQYADLKKFYVVNPGEFVFNPRTSRNGAKTVPATTMPHTTSSLLISARPRTAHGLWRVPVWRRPQEPEL